MTEAKFKHYDLKLVEPSFSSSLTDMIIELDYLRKKKLGGSTHPMVFFQLKDIFHTLESIGSARIEGNNTTIAEYIETKIEPEESVPEKIREIQNIEAAMDFIEENTKFYPIDKIFISELHKKIVTNLTPPPKGEGDQAPGEYRKDNVKIANAYHIPPDFFTVNDYMNELFSFINQKDHPKYDLLKVAIAHHRFVWIHPFSNGNGRTVRLFTYALLVKLGFNVEKGRILNPTAIFCGHRENYYNYLAKADDGEDQNILEWCEYVLKGLKEEIEKVDRLLDHKYLYKNILQPAIHFSLEQKYITNIEARILMRISENQIIKASNLKDIFMGKANSEISRQIKKLIDKKMLVPEKERAQKYIIRFDNNYLLRGIIKALSEKNFLPMNKDI